MKINFINENGKPETHEMSGYGRKSKQDVYDFACYLLWRGCTKVEVIEK